MLDKKNFYINGKWVSPLKPNDFAIVKCKPSRFKWLSTKIVLITSFFVSKIMRILYMECFNFSNTKIQFFICIFTL